MKARSNQLKRQETNAGDHIDIQNLDELSEEQLAQFFNNLYDINNLFELINYYDKNKFTTNQIFMDLLIDAINNSLNSEFQYQSIICALFIVITKNNTDIVDYMIQKSLHEFYLANFPAIPVFFPLAKMCKRNNAIAECVISSQIIDRCAELIQHDINSLFYVLRLFRSFCNRFELYQYLLGFYTFLVDFLFNPSNNLLNQHKELCLKVISRFCYNLEFAQLFFNHPSLINFINQMNDFQVQSLFVYVIYVSFTQTKGNTMKINDRIVHVSRLLADSLQPNVYEYLLNFVCNFINPEVDQALVECSINALGSLVQYRDAHVLVLKKIDMINYVIEISKSEVSFEFKKDSFHLLSILYCLDIDFAKYLIQNEFSDVIQQFAELIQEISVIYVMNILDKSEEYQHEAEEIFNLLHDDWVIEVLSELEDVDYDDEYGLPIADRARTLLQKLEEED